MDYKKLSANSWSTLSGVGDLVSGYFGTWLSLNEGEESHLLIFKDSSSKYHLVVEDSMTRKNELYDPGVKGLQINLGHYRFQDGKVKQFIDLQCSMDAYIGEFTKITIEIAERILERNQSAVNSVNEVLIKWKTFWSAQNKNLLTNEELIGLICELEVLKNLCLVNPAKALNSWMGPVGGHHDFLFSDCAIEVKGTTVHGPTHTINGLDQLLPPENKELVFVSFLVTPSDDISSISISDKISEIIENYLQGRADLIEFFRDQLAKGGYSLLYEGDYSKFKIEILESRLFVVNPDFPKLTSHHLLKPIDDRVSEIRYRIDLQGLSGILLSEVDWTAYCQ